MIRTRMTGGLGNQLFQWACAKNLQKKYGHPIQFEDHILASSRNRDIMNFPNITWNTKEYIKNEYTSGENIPYSVHQDQFSFSDFSRIDFTKNEFFHLIGYWQGVDYFKESQEEIRESLRPNQQFIDNNKSMFLQSSRCVSLHFRRTDYIGKDDHHPIPPMTYYEKALEMVDYDRIFVFSDDIPWCKENLKFNNMTFVHNINPLHDLWIMSFCQSNIIANSTFSWWGAWLNDNPNKKVIMPRKWFGPSAPSDKDITNVDWIKLTHDGEIAND